MVASLLPTLCQTKAGFSRLALQLLTPLPVVVLIYTPSWINKENDGGRRVEAASLADTNPVSMQCTCVQAEGPSVGAGAESLPPQRRQGSAAIQNWRPLSLCRGPSLPPLCPP